MKEYLLKNGLIVIFLTIFMPLMATDYYEYINMEVGEQKTFYVNSLISSNINNYRVKSWSWTVDGEGLSIISKNVRNCTVRADKSGSVLLLYKITFESDDWYYPTWESTISNIITIKRNTVPVSNVTINSSSVSMTVGETEQLTATVSPINASDKTVSWLSSNSSVATVSSNGLITAKSAGSATITCRANDGNGKYATCAVTVSAVEPTKVTSISLNYTSTSMYIGDTKQLSATVSPSNATDKTVNWSSSNSSIATVDNTGKVTAKARGTATITCKANDGSGKYATCYVTVTNPDVTVAEINATNFPDESFRSWLLSQTYGSDGKLTESEISSITSINVSGSSASSPGTIKSLKGIEYFTALTSLYCYYNQLTSLDVSKLTALTDLRCQYNQLTSLDVSKLTALTSLACQSNQLTSLDVSKLTELTFLICENNQLTSLDVSKLTALKTLRCYDNQLTTLDVSKLTTLTDLYCHYNQLTSLDVSRLTALTYLSCFNNQLTALDVSRLTALTYLFCGGNKLTALDVSKLTALKTLWCENNQLTALDVSKNTALTFLSCYNNSIKGTAMDNLISSLPKNNTDEVHHFQVVGQYLYNEGNVCTTTQVAAVKAKGWFPCSYYDYTIRDYVEYKGSDDGVVEINATNFPDAGFRSWLLSQSYGADGKLTESEINSITSINVSGSYIKSLKGIEYFTSLTWLACENNQLTSLDVSNLTALTWLDCMVNQLTSLDVSRLTTLKTLYCDNNQLTSLDVSKSIGLEYLVCSNNQLTALDVSKNTSLTWLLCNNNKLKTLNISKNTALTILYCEHNQLTTLDVSKNTALYFLSCNNNSIKGTAMDYLISSLPKNNTGEVHRFRVVGEDLSNESNVCTTTQVAAVKAKGWFPCYYDSTTKESVEYEGSDGTTGSKGDVNGDGQVNGTDLVALTNIILGKSSKTDAADVNGDGYVNGTDYVALANIVLGRSNAKASAMAKGAIQAVATTGLTIETFDIKAGESKELVIDLTNPNDEITLVQFDLRLPAGLSVKQTGGEYDIDIAGRTTWRKHSLDANATNGIVRFLLASSSNATLTGTEGAVIKITIAADNCFTGGDIQLENILMVTPAEKEIKQDVYTYHVGQSQPSPSSTGLAIEPFSISAGGEAEMVIDMTNPDDEITLVQFDLRLPAGLSVKQTGGEYDYDIAGRTTWRKHSLDANATNGIVRFLLASSSNATLTGTEGAVIKMTLKADNTFSGGAVKLENILLVTPAEKEIRQPNVNYNIGATGIKGVVADDIKKDATIYNLSGQRLDKPRKGINIIGGKKVMVK